MPAGRERGEAGRGSTRALNGASGKHFSAKRWPVWKHASPFPLHARHRFLLSL